MKNIVALWCVLLLFYSCRPKHDKIENVERAYYYWASKEFGLSQREDSILLNNKVKKLYVKFFEVDYNIELGTFPTSKTNVSVSDYAYSATRYTTDSVEIIPTVYLKNEVFLNIAGDELDTLASNVNFLLNKYSTEKFENKSSKEIQMDCDWTPKSKNNYFEFLKKLKRISGKEISCTLRLYPYKYPDKMGVPPVDKAMLMCYNLLNPLESKDRNSILDVDELEKYISGSSRYPKHLDVALPVYSWLQVYQNNQFQGIVYSSKDFKKSFRQIKPLWYQSEKDTMVENVYIRKGDMLKLEEVSSKDITTAISRLKKHVYFDKSITVALFSLDESQNINYTNEEISGFYSSFSK